MAGDHSQRTKHSKKRRKQVRLSLERPKTPHTPPPDPEMVSLPKNWFALEFHKALRKRIRGPIAKTRRRMLTFKQRVPKEVMYEMLSKLKEGDAMAMDGSPITWQEDGQVAPTNISSANLTYHIKLPKPMAVDRLLSLERADPKGVHAKDGKGEWLHGQGCAVLKLADKSTRCSQASALCTLCVARTIPIV